MYPDYSSNQTQAVYPRDKTVVQLIEEQVVRNPGATAMVDSGGGLTYQQLNERANQLAHYLLANFRIQPDDRIGILTDRSPAMLVAMLGVLKTGAAFVPIDKSYPDDRIQFILKDAALLTLVLDKRSAGASAESSSPQGVVLSEFEAQLSAYPTTNPASIQRPTDLAYIIYTSGSTGQPKGVMLEHASLVNLCYWHRAAFGMDESCRSTVYAGTGFDASVWEVFPVMVFGGALFPVPADSRLDIEKLVYFLNDQGITHAFLPTMICEQLQLQTYVRLSDSLLVLTGGDRLKKVADSSLRIVNNYGPTESTVVATSAVVGNDAPLGLVSIGKPIHNTRIYILDDALEPVPMGSTGEICIAGDGLARGYLNQPELTAQKFVDNPFEPGRKLYRTSDLGYWADNGQLYFEGRKDDQVKIRDYRIEPGEIEVCLTQHPAIQQALVIARDDAQGHKYLVAYYLSDALPVSGELRRFLTDKLPPYMIPSFFVRLDEIPLTPNGKISKKDLPAPSDLEQRETPYVPPATETEAQLALIWQEVMGQQNPGVLDNFFDVGGHSLKAMRIVHLISQQWGVRLALDDILQQPTIRSLAALLAVVPAQTGLSPITSVANKAHYDVSHAQRGLWLLDQFQKGTFTPHVAEAYIFDGALRPDYLKDAFDRIMARHESLRTTFAMIEGEPRQCIQPVSPDGHLLNYIDLRTDADRENTARRLADQEEITPFDLEIGPLLRTTLLQLTETRYVFLLTMHHIISDGWSMEILVHEILAVYNACCRGEEASLPALQIQYKDYSTWLNEQLRGNSLANLRQYWLNQFSGKLPQLQLPLDNARPPIKSNQFGSATAFLDRQQLVALNQLSHQQGATLFMTLVASVTAFLHRWSEQEDIVMGTAILGRDHPDLQNLLGIFTNTLPLRMQINGHHNFLQLLSQAQAVTLGAFAHQLYPFDWLIDDLNIAKDLSRSPLFDVMITLSDREMVGLADQEMEGVSIEPFATEGITIQYDLVFGFKATGGGLLLNLEYCTALFEAETITLMLEKWQLLMRGLIASPNCPIRDHQLALSVEQQLYDTDLSLEFSF